MRNIFLSDCASLQIIALKMKMLCNILTIIRKFDII